MTLDNSLLADFASGRIDPNRPDVWAAMGDVTNGGRVGPFSGPKYDANGNIVKQTYSLGGQSITDPWYAQQRGIDLYNKKDWLDTAFAPALVMMGGALAGGALGAGAAGGGATPALTEVSLPASAVPIGTGTSLDALAAGGVATLPAAAGGGAVAGGGIGSRILGALSGGSNSPWLTIGQIGASLLGGAQGANAAEHAADAQAQAAADALQFQRESRDIALGLIRPEVDASQAALGRMLDMTGTARPESLGASQPFDITEDPSYQFRLNEGMKALENSAAARGGLMSGGFAKKALRYAQDYASTEYSNIYNRLASIANRSPVATSEGNIALNFGANAGNLTLNRGDARASGYIAQGNSWANAMNQIALALGRNFGTPATPGQP